MDSNNMGYLSNMAAYDADLDYGSGTGDYWQQNAYSQTDAQPTHSAPFFQSNQDLFSTDGSQQKPPPMFNFTGTPAQPYQSYPTTAMSTPFTTNFPNLAQRQQMLPPRNLKIPPSKRQRMASTSQPGYQNRPATSAVHEADQASLCGSQSECCSSCSGGIPCDEPDCEPCDEVDCTGTAVEVCSEKSCSKPACRDECLSTAFQNQTSLGQGDEATESSILTQNAPWNPQMVQQGMGQSHRASNTTIVDPAIIDPSPIPTTPSMAGNSETPGSPYPALPTPQNHMFDQEATYSNPATGDLSGTGSMFNGSSEQWTNTAYGDMNNGSAPEMLPCSWEGCEFVCMSHEEWISHFHMAHIDTQMSFGCPIPADNCPPTIDTNPMDHLQNFHGYNFDFSSGAFSCPATTCPPDQTYLSPRMLHDHFDLAHATPVQGSLSCRLQTCGTVFDDPNQFISHMNYHLQAPVSKTEEEIVLQAPSLPATATATLKSETKIENPGSVSIPHLCMWKSKSGERCNYEGLSPSDLQDHVKDQHLSSLGKSTGYVCQWDGCRRDSNLGEKSGFSQRGKLERHMATHTGFKCSVCETCGQMFSAPQALRQHILLHTGEKPWKCKHCDKRFPQQSACTIHERTHTNEKPLECNICGKKFSESSNLAKHRKIHGEKGLHVCPISGCGKSFHRLDQLKRHALTHDKPPKDTTRKRAPRKPKATTTATAASESETIRAETFTDGGAESSDS